METEEVSELTGTTRPFAKSKARDMARLRRLPRTVPATDNAAEGLSQCRRNTADEACRQCSSAPPASSPIDAAAWIRRRDGLR